MGRFKKGILTAFCLLVCSSTGVNPALAAVGQITRTNATSSHINPAVLTGCQLNPNELAVDLGTHLTAISSLLPIPNGGQAGPLNSKALASVLKQRIQTPEASPSQLVSAWALLESLNDPDRLQALRQYLGHTGSLGNPKFSKHVVVGLDQWATLQNDPRTRRSLERMVAPLRRVLKEKLSSHEQLQQKIQALFDGSLLSKTASFPAPVRETAPTKFHATGLVRPVTKRPSREVTTGHEMGDDAVPGSILIGPIPETAGVDAVAIALPSVTFDEFDRALMLSLPRSTKLLTIGTHQRLEKEFTAEFASGRFQRYSLNTVSPWIRDYFPEFVINADGRTELVRFRTEPGRIIQGRNLPPSWWEELSNTMGLPIRASPLVLEGGNILVDDKGNLFLTRIALKHNSKLTRKQIEVELKRALAVQTVNWMPTIPNEGTGHIDLYAKYVGNNTVLVADSHDLAAKRVLESAASIFRNKGYNVVRVTNADESQKLSFSYVNSVLVNGTAIIPSFFDPTLMQHHVGYAENLKTLSADRRAAKLYRDLGFKVIQVPSYRAAHSGGAVHCLVRQIPRLRLNLAHRR